MALGKLYAIYPRSSSRPREPGKKAEGERAGLAGLAGSALKRWRCQAATDATAHHSLGLLAPNS